ncbi:MAG: DUF4350 domain-containing protein [Geminicoccaceae bacterium]
MAIMIGIMADRFDSVTAGNNIFSDSAFGHKAFAQLLKQAGLPVLVARHDLIDKLNHNDLLVMIEPPIGYLAEWLDQIHVRADSPPHLLVVLPKRSGYIATHGNRWFQAKELVPTQDIEPYLGEFGIEGDVVRPAREPDKLEVSTLLETSSVPTAPDLQLVDSDELRSLARNDEGILLGQTFVDGRRTYLLSDPDILSNHGLDDGDNALFVVQMAVHLTRSKGTVVIDAEAHGFSRPPSLWHMLIEPPFVVLALQLAALTIVLLLIGWQRMGPVTAEHSGMAGGSDAVITPMAELLTMPGRRRDLLQAYLEVARQDRLRTKRAPISAQNDVFDRTIKNRQSTFSHQAAVDIARQIHQWRGHDEGGRGKP